ncbi:MAG: serine protease, partial [Reyranella sp.]
MARLGAKQTEKLVRELSGALSLDEIELYLGVATGDRLFDEYAGQNMPKNKVLYTLVEALDQQGTLILFLQEVYERRPHRTDLLDYLRKEFQGADRPRSQGVVLDTQEGGERVADAAGADSAAPGLQRYVRKELGAVDLLVWIAGGLKVAERVCRIEKDGNALGTGFLVGPDLVLTNWHVVRGALPANDTDDLTCRFDYAVNPGGGIQNGDEINVAPSGIIVYRPCSAAELTETPDKPPPSPTDLDYAVLRLSGSPGTKRGWMDLTQTPMPPKKDAPLFILQHPAAAPLKLAFDTQAVIGFEHGGLRLRYHTNTDHGSSGSPCLSMDWKLLALHHLGDPQVAKPVFNQGVPIDLIRNDLHAQGH